MVSHIGIMIVAMIISMIVMLLSAAKISAFVEKHPTIKILALSFLILIGVMLVAESMGQHVSKGYIYFAMAFSLLVESINIRYRSKHSGI
jgi:predicted tellurium resistance membrane protein TerC